MTRVQGSRRREGQPGIFPRWGSTRLSRHHVYPWHRSANAEALSMKLATRVNVLLIPSLVLSFAPARGMQAVPPAPIVIQADRILDGRGQVLRDTRIVIENGKIAR